MENRRHFTRILFSIKADLTIENQTYPVSIHDISLSGALVSTPKADMSLVGKQGDLTFALSDDDSKVNMIITVIHVHDDDTGLQCHTIDINSVTILRRLVELNLGDSKQLDKELSQLSRTH